MLRYHPCRSGRPVPARPPPARLTRPASVRPPLDCPAPRPSGYARRHSPRWASARPPPPDPVAHLPPFRPPRLRPLPDPTVRSPPDRSPPGRSARLPPVQPPIARPPHLRHPLARTWAPPRYPVGPRLSREIPRLCPPPPPPVRSHVASRTPAPPARPVRAASGLRPCQGFPLGSRFGRPTAVLKE